MSDTLTADPAGPEDDDVRAGEYVLGLLEPDEARAFEARAAADAALARAIARWERDLSPLLALVTPVDPPAALWTRLERSAFGARPTAPASVTLPFPTRPARRTLNPWGAGAIGFALAAGLASVAFLARPTPSALPLPVAALVPKTPGAPVVVADLLPDGRLSVRPVSALATPAGRDYELWSLPSGATKPVPLGLLPGGGTVVPAGQVPTRSGLILISLEPTGGSPTGLPTGPVLWAGTFGGRT